MGLNVHAAELRSCAAGESLRSGRCGLFQRTKVNRSSMDMELKSSLLFVLLSLWSAVSCVNAGFADLPRLAIKASTHYDFGLQTVSKIQLFSMIRCAQKIMNVLS